MTHIQAVTFVTAWLALIVLWGFRAADDSRFSNISMLAVWASLGALTDPILLLPVTVTLGYLSLVRRSLAGPADAARCVALTAGIIVVALTPWTLRNWVAHDRLVPIKDSFWYTLWQGNGPGASGTDKLILPPRNDDIEPSAMSFTRRFRRLLYERRRSVSVNVALPAEFLAQLARMPLEIHRMDAFGRRIREFLREHPGHYVKMCLRRLWYLVTFDPTNPKSTDPFYLLSYISLAALTLVGAIVSRDRWPLLIPVYGAMGGVALPSIFIITSARFRLPAEAFLILLAAIGLTRLGYFPTTKAGVASFQESGGLTRFS